MSYSAEVLADSPTCYYRLDETSGTTTLDSSGNARAGFYTGTYTLNQTGLLSNDSNACFSMNQGGVQISAAAWQNTSFWTAEAWIYPTNVSGNRTIVMHDDHGAQIAWRLFLNGTTLSCYWKPTGASLELLQGGTCPVNTISHVVATYDGTSLKLYLNGTNVATRNQSGTTQSVSSGIRMGEHDSSHNEPFIGRMDEVSVYNYALSAARVSAHYAAAFSSAATLTLSGAVPPPTGSFSVSTTRDMALSGVVPAVTGAFALTTSRDMTLSGVVPAVTGAFSLDNVTVEWHVDLDIGGLTWSIDKGDPAAPGPLDGLRIGWRYPSTDVYPTQPEPVTATIRLLVEDIADIVSTIDEGSPVIIEISGSVHASFVGRVAELQAVPVKRLVAGVEQLVMLVTFRCVDYTVDRAADQVGGTVWPAEDSADRLARIVTEAGMTTTVLPTGDPVPVAEREAKPDNAKNVIEHYLKQWPIVNVSLPEPHRAILAPDGETIVEIPAHTTGGRFPARLAADGTMVIDAIPPAGATLTPWVWPARQILFDATWSRLKQNGVTAVAVTGDEVGIVLDDSGAVPRVTATVDSVDLVDVDDAELLAHMYRSNVDDNGAWVADGFTFLAYRDGSPLAETSPILATDNAADVLTGTVTIYGIPPTQNPAHPGADWYTGTLSAAELSITRGRPYLTFTLRPDIPRPPDDDPIALTWDDLKAAPYVGLAWDDLDPNITWADARLLRRP